MVRFQKLTYWLLPQLNTNYDDYILQLDDAPPHPHFHKNVDALQKETTTFSLGHPVRRI